MIVKASERNWRAYTTAFLIGWSYIWLWLKSKVFGQAFFDNRIEGLHIKNAERLKASILALSGLFIKVGQLLSVMSNVVPKAYGGVLESLQDNTPSSSYSVVKETIEKALNIKLEEVFQSFEELPLASASIGQVHKAILHNGDEVAVKIQHAYIKELAAIDLNIIENLIKTVIRFFKIQGLEHVYEQVKQMIYEELDYKHETEALQIIKENCKEIDGIVIPEVYSDYSSDIILTSKFYEGVKITNTKKLKEWDINLEATSEKLLYTYCEMILNHGVYHADPHPGNLLVNKEGEIIILDFGAVARLSPDMPKKISFFFQAVLTKDQDNVLNAMRDMGFIAKGKSASATAVKIIDAISEFIQEGVDVNNIGFEDLNNESIRNLRANLSIKELTSSLQVPKDWILLERTLRLVHGVSMNIAPQLSPLDIIKPYIKELMLKDGGLKEMIVNVLKKQAGILISLPEKVDSLLNKANKGDLQFEVKDYDKNTNKIYAVGRQIIFVLVGMFCFSLAFLSRIQEQVEYEKYFTYAAVISLVLFLYSSWKHRK